MNTTAFFSVSPDIKKTIEAGGPVVALESTIISHGMPYPENVKTAREVEEIVRANGAVPATIAVIAGKIRIGLSPEEIEFLGGATAGHGSTDASGSRAAEIPRIRKASRRDLALVVSRGEHASTTVAATMICAAAAGIPVFATGGIGGVHRGGQMTMDISADLRELGQTPVTVICAGAKAILDIGLTLEYMETMGVPVIGYRTSEFPAFYSAESGFSLEYRADTPEEIARIISVQRTLGLVGGILVANPVPREYEIPRKEIEPWIARALEEAEKRGIKGKETTPFLLSRMESLTAGRSLATNIALIRNNAALAARIAAALAARG
jgi:pseudouridine-5'-phosphate glycosidase